MKIKTSELKGAALDWAVANAIGKKVHKQFGWTVISEQIDDVIAKWSPSTIWGQGGPLIDAHDVNLTSCLDLKGAVIGDHISGFVSNAETFLLAAMRVIVMAKLGEEVEIPDELAEAAEI